MIAPRTPTDGPEWERRSVASYDRSAAGFAALYESTTFERVHGGILDLLPPPAADVLDVGAGSGRDAAALGLRGHRVTAVEPSSGLRAEASSRHAGSGIEWIDDVLPDLATLRDRTFDFVLLSAVWTQLPPLLRAPSMRRLAALLRTGAPLAMTLRGGVVVPGPDPVASDHDLASVAEASGLTLLRSSVERDAIGRADLSWSTFVFVKPSPTGKRTIGRRIASSVRGQRGAPRA